MTKSKFTIVIFLLIVILVLVFYNNSSNYNDSTVSINSYVFKTEVVKSPEKMMRGLSGRQSLADDQAMLFVFSGNSQRVFWMKEMNFDIDLLWIDNDKVIAYQKNMLAPDKDTPANELPRYTSPQEVDKVLEIKSGLIDSLGIKVGDIIQFES